jgi:TPR repeat protein
MYLRGGGGLKANPEEAVKCWLRAANGKEGEEEKSKEGEKKSGIEERGSPGSSSSSSSSSQKYGSCSEGTGGGGSGGGGGGGGRCPQAEFNLGVCFAEGRGVAQSYEEANKWYARAAIAATAASDTAATTFASSSSGSGSGSGDSGCGGSRHGSSDGREGEGGARSNPQSDMSRSGRAGAGPGAGGGGAGSVDALFELGMLRSKGLGVEQSACEAVKLWTLAAERGHAAAMVRERDHAGEKKLVVVDGGARRDGTKEFFLFSLVGRKRWRILASYSLCPLSFSNSSPHFPGTFNHHPLARRILHD